MSDLSDSSTSPPRPLTRRDWISIGVMGGGFGLLFGWAQARWEWIPPFADPVYQWLAATVGPVWAAIIPWALIVLFWVAILLWLRRSPGGGQAPGKSALSLALLLLTACGSPSASDQPSVSVTEEEGLPLIQIEGLWDDNWPTLPGQQIDTLLAPDDPEAPPLVAPAFAAILADGSLAVADVRGGRIWLKGPDGSWTPGVGVGNGPDDVLMIGGLWSDGDDLLVVDGQRHQLVRFPDGRTATDRVPLESGSASAPTPWPWELHPVGGSTWLVATPARGEVTEGNMEGEFTFRLLNVGPGANASEGEGVTGERVFARGPAHPLFTSGGGGAPRPFAPRAMAAAAPAGGALSGGLVFTPGTEPVVTAFSTSGEEVFRVRWHSPPRPLEDRHRDLFFARMRDAAPPGFPPGQFDAFVEQLTPLIPWPEHLTHLGELRQGPDGSVWLGWPERTGVGSPGFPDPITEWRVVSFELAGGEGQGEPRVHRVSLPPGVHLLEPVSGGVAGQPAFFVLLRDAMERTGVGVLRYAPL